MRTDYEVIEICGGFSAYHPGYPGHSLIGWYREKHDALMAVAAHKRMSML